MLQPQGFQPNRMPLHQQQPMPGFQPIGFYQQQAAGRLPTADEMQFQLLQQQQQLWHHQEQERQHMHHMWQMQQRQVQLASSHGSVQAPSVQKRPALFQSAAQGVPVPVSPVSPAYGQQANWPQGHHLPAPPEVTMHWPAPDATPLQQMPWPRPEEGSQMIRFAQPAAERVTLSDIPSALTPAPSHLNEALRSAQQQTRGPGGVATAAGDTDQLLAKHGYVVAREEDHGPGLPPGAVGRGGFGIVYKARRGGETFAVKLAEKVFGGQSAIEAEVKVLRLLQHPGIVRFVESFAEATKGWVVVVMEFIDGGNLSQALISRPHFFSEALMRAMMFHIACALAHAHELGVMHRDVKPENIMLRSSDWFPKIADFGLARAFCHGEMAVTIAGTPSFMAPEVANPQVPYDCPADVFSLGLVFSCMMDDTYNCRWVLPMLGDAERQGLQKRWPPGTSAPQVSQELQQLQQQMVQQAPGQRPTLLDVCHQLQALHRRVPLTHGLWQVPTIIPSSPPVAKAVTQQTAADIAGRGGYAIGAAVQVKLDNAWHNGRVMHVSTTLSPGALQVHFRPQGSAEESAVLICPWQFADLLRPVPTFHAEQPLTFRTMVFVQPPSVAPTPVPVVPNVAGQAARSSSRLAQVPVVIQANCKPKNCSIQ